MPKQKSLQRKLAELISRRESIKVKSAARRIQRAAKAEKPLVGLTRRQKEYFREYLETRKKPVKPEFTHQWREYRYSFDFAGVRLCKLFGHRVVMGSTGSGDIRDRWINHPITAKQAELIFNSVSFEDAVNEFVDLVSYVVDVGEPTHFRFSGKVYNENDF